MSLLVSILVIAGDSDSDTEDQCSVRDHERTPPDDPTAQRYELRDSDFGISSGEGESTPPHPRLFLFHQCLPTNILPIYQYTITNYDPAIYYQSSSTNRWTVRYIQVL